MPTVCRGYYGARASGLKIRRGKKTRQEEKRNDEKKRAKSKWQMREMMLYRAARRNKTEFMSRTYLSFETAMRLHFARSGQSD